MPPYMRFPETEAIQQKFWGFRPRNPTCGRVSLEAGTKFFAWTNIVLYALAVVLCVICLIMVVPTFSSQPTQQELVDGLMQSRYTETTEDWLHKIHFKQQYAMAIAMLIVGLIGSSAMVFLFWKLKKAAIEKDVPLLKRCFVVILLLEICLTLFWDVESEINWTSSIIFDIPYTIFQIMGLIFTYSFIVSLVNPDSSQHDDLNRIQFSA